MKVIVKSQKDREAVEKLNIKDILIVIKIKESKKVVKEIIATRRLLSENILFSILTKRVKNIFKKVTSGYKLLYRRSRCYKLRF
jgi:hypothetical protein